MQMQELRDQLEVLVDQLSRLADAKRMYGNVRPALASRHGAVGRGTAATLPGGNVTCATTPASTSLAAAPAVGAPTQPPTAASSASPGSIPAHAASQQPSSGAGGKADAQMDVEALLRRADECSSRMLALLADEPHAVTAHQPLRGAALLAAALSAYLRGGGTSEAALSGLQAAVKLRPLNPTAWNCLAHSYWERGDLFMAGCCLNSGLRHCPNVAGHQMMSLLVRQQGGAAAPPAAARAPSGRRGRLSHDVRRGATGVASSATSTSASASSASFNSSSTVSSLSAALTASLAHARRALDLDLENGYSWYVLAMAQMADYFRGDHQPWGAAGGGGGGGGGGTGGGGSGGGSGRGGRGDLHRVLAAFAQAERCGCSDLPDLYYNRAALHAFVQDFGPALQDYSRAASLDPSLPAPAQMESLLVLLGQLSGLVAARGGVKERNWAAVTTLLAADAARASELLPFMSHERLSLRGVRELQPGSNRGHAVMCRALVFVSPPLNASGTLYLVGVDTSGCVLVVALTHIHHDAFDMTQLLTIAHPELRHVDLTWPPPPPPPPEPAPPPPPPHPPGPTQPPATPPPSTSSQPPPPTAPSPTALPSPSPSSSTSTVPERPPKAAAALPPAPEFDQASGSGSDPGFTGRGSSGSGPPGSSHQSPPSQPAPPPSSSAPAFASSPSLLAPRSYRFPLLLVGCDPGGRSSVLVDGVPLHQAPQTPLLRNVMRVA